MTVGTRWVLAAGLITLCFCDLDKDNASRAAKAKRVQTTLARLNVPRANEEIGIDGALTEPSWKNAAETGWFVNTLDGSSNTPLKARAKLLWSKEYLYVAFEVHDRFLKSTFSQPDDHLWEQDVVEVYLQPPGSAAGYYEMQVSPAGIVFDTRFTSRRAPPPFGVPAWSSDLQAGIVLRGHLNDGSSDRGYTVEIALPWKAFGQDAPEPNGTQTDTWRANLFVLDLTAEGNQTAAAWSPPLVGDFHAIHRFRPLHFMQ